MFIKINEKWPAEEAFKRATRLDAGICAFERNLLMMKDKTGKNFFGVSVTIMFSKLLGFLRDILVAASIGTSKLADIYSQVFGVPSLLFTSIGMALSTVNIPNLTHYLANESEEKRKKYVSALFTHIFLAGSAVSVCGILLAPPVAKVILPGLDDNAASAIAVTLTRIMFPTLLFISFAYITAGILQVHRHFLISSLISIPYNIAIIAALFIKKGDIIWLGYATAFGWLLQFLVQLPVLFKEKYRLGFELDLKNKHVNEVFLKIVPILLGNAVLQVCQLVGRAFASHLEEGSTAALSYGSNLFMIITSIFIVAMSTVTFPDLSKYCMENDFEKVASLLRYIFRMLFFILIPYLIIVIMYSEEIIRLVYERGSFTERSTAMTSMAFLCYSFCIFGYMAQEIFNRVYYALKKFKIPMILSIVCILTNLVMVSLSFKTFGIAGIAGSTAVSFTIYAVVMTISIRKKIGGFLKKDFAVFLGKLAVCSLCFAAVGILFRLLDFEGAVMGFLAPVATGGLAYLAAAYFTGVLKETLLRRT